MRIIIISDVSANSESIIPWGLNLGKHTGSEVDILHLIDPRENQGVESQIGDSKSVTPGEKLSFEEIREREKGIAVNKLDKLLSKEASRLNYPLKINRIIETGELEKKLKIITSDHPRSLLVTSTIFKGNVFRDLDEFLSIIKNIDIPAFMVPPGTAFNKPEKVFFLTDFSQSPGDDLSLMFEWINPFHPVVNACEVTKKMDQFISAEIVGKTWKQKVKEYIDPSIVLKTNKLKGDNHIKTVSNYVERNDFEWVILPKKKKESKKKIFSVNITRQLVKSLDKPLLLY